MIPIPVNIPWKLIGVGVLVLVILLSGLKLVAIGKDSAKKDALIEELSADLVTCIAGQTKLIGELARVRRELVNLETVAYEANARYAEVLNRPPAIRYLPYAGNVTTTIPVGNCDIASAAAWHLLETSMFLDRHRR